MSGLVWALVFLTLHLAGWAHPWVDFSSLALVAVGWGMGLEAAALTAWALGLFLDAASLGPLGIQAAAWTAAAAALAVEQRAAHRAETPTLMLAVLLSALWLGLATSLGRPEILPWILRSCLSALAAPLLLWPLRRGWAPPKALA